MGLAMGKTIEDVAAEMREVAARTVKTCQCCLKPSPPGAPTCLHCGECSWSAPVDIAIRYPHDELRPRAAAVRNVVLQCLRLFRDAANGINGVTATLTDDVEPATIAGAEAAVFARLTITDPRQIGTNAPNITMVFATRYNAIETDGFVVGCVSVAPHHSALWPLRWVRFRDVSPDSTVDVIASLLAEAVYGDL